jgi:hypothetical protein
MDVWVWILIAVVVLVAIAVIAWAVQRSRRTSALKERFGPEYDRVASDASSKRDAEAELRGREQRRSDFDIKPLDPGARERYSEQWEAVQARFVDDPAGAVTEADVLIQSVMRDRGYPVEDFETRSADLSVDHPDVVENYRAAHGIATAYARGNAGTEELRHAVKHYRSLFQELLEARDTQEVTR